MRRRHHHHEGLLGALVRVAWGRRLETTLALAATGARLVMWNTAGVRVGSGLLAVAAGGLVCHAPTRRALVRRSVGQARERWFARGIASTELFDPRHAPELVDVQATRGGFALQLRLSPRVTTEDLASASERLAVAFGARAVRVTRDPAHAGRACMVVLYADPLSHELSWPWAGYGPLDLWQSIPFGYDEDGEAAWLSLAEHHVLIGGEPGAGKSNALSLLVAAAAADPSVELWLFDGKLVELARWSPVAKRFVGSDVTEAIVALEELRLCMAERYERLLAEGLNKIRPGLGMGLVLVVIDELVLYLGGPKAQREAFAEALRDLVARGRAAGIVVVAATQKPSADAVPSGIRDLFGYRLALRCTTRDASDTILGGGWASLGYSAADVDAATRGVGWWRGEGTVPRRIRCFRMDDDTVAWAQDSAVRIRVDAGRSKDPS